MPQNDNQTQSNPEVIARDLTNVMDLMNHEVVGYQKTKVYSQQVLSSETAVRPRMPAP